MKLPEHIKDNLTKDKKYYSLYNMKNIERCKVDSDYLGDVLLVNEKMIWYCVHKYVGNLAIILSNAGVEKEDILQLGRLGFIKAIQRFDTTRNIKFSSFAMTAIKREIRCYVRDNKLLRLTRNAHSLNLKIKELENNLGYLPTVEKLALLLNESTDNIEKILTIGKPVKYLDEIMDGDPFDYIIDPSTEDHESSIVNKVYIENLIDSIKDKLDSVDLKILKSQLQENTKTKTAIDNNVSQMKVIRTLRKIKELLKEEEYQIPPTA